MGIEFRLYGRMCDRQLVRRRRRPRRLAWVFKGGRNARIKDRQSAASAEECRDEDDCEARCLHHARVTLQQEEQKSTPDVTRAVA